MIWSPHHRWRPYQSLRRGPTRSRRCLLIMCYFRTAGEWSVEAAPFLSTPTMRFDILRLEKLPSCTATLATFLYSLEKLPSCMATLATSPVSLTALIIWWFVCLHTPTVCQQEKDVTAFNNKEAANLAGSVSNSQAWRVVHDLKRLQNQPSFRIFAGGDLVFLHCMQRCVECCVSSIVP